MRKITTAILLAASALLLVCAINIQAQTTNVPSPSGFATIVKNFFANNPTNTWDVSGYGVASESDHFGYGAGARVGYWVTPSVGAALDFSYVDSSWTFTSLGLAGRGTINIGSIGTISPYGSLGAGWNLKGGSTCTSGNCFVVRTATGTANALVYSASYVLVAGGGGTLHINKLTWFDLFGEYQHLTDFSGGASQDRVLFGLTRKF